MSTDSKGRFRFISSRALAAATLFGMLRAAAATEPPPLETTYVQANAHYRQGIVLASNKDYAAAAREFSEATSLNPRFGAAYFWLGICDSQDALDDQAIQDFQNALTWTRDTRLGALIHYDLGIQYLKKGEEQLAEREHQTAVQMNPALARLPMMPRPTPPRKEAKSKGFVAIPRPSFWAVYWRAFLVLATYLLIFIIAAAKSRKNVKRPDPPPPVLNAPQWSLEPELLSSTPPRRLVLRGAHPLGKFLALIPLYLMIAVITRLPSALERLYILRNGAAETAIVQNIYQVASRVDLPTIYFKIAYRTESGRFATAEKAVLTARPDQKGSIIRIHHVPRCTGCVALDDDYGRTADDLALAFVLLATIPAFIPFAFFSQRKIRYLLRYGRPVGAVVEAVGVPGRVYLHLPGDGERLVKTAVPPKSAPKLGQTVTALIHPRYPNDALVYASAPYRAEPAQSAGS